MTRTDHFAVFGISHIEVPVSDLDRATTLYLDGLGFVRKQAGPGWVDLDASSLTLRLLETKGDAGRASLRIQVTELQPACAALVRAGAREVEAARRATDQEIMLASLADPDGNSIIVWRQLSEDEADYLPKPQDETEWSRGAERLLESLLVAVPALFRALVRRRVVRLAEELYPGAVITEAQLVRAYLLASAKVTRHRLRELLLRHGHDPDDFSAEFESD